MPSTRRARRALGSVYYRSNGIYLFGSQAAIDPRRTGRALGTNIQVFGATVPTLRTHNEIVIHYPRALNDCTPATSTGASSASVTRSSGWRSQWTRAPSSSSQTDDVLRGAGAQSCTTCHQFGASFPYFDGLAATANIQAHVNATGFAPQAFPAGRGSSSTSRLAGSSTCP